MGERRRPIKQYGRERRPITQYRREEEAYNTVGERGEGL